MTTTIATSASQVVEDFGSSVQVDVEAQYGLVEGKFSGNFENRQYMERNEEKTQAKITSEAVCVVYHLKIPKFSKRPELTTNFKKGVATLIQAFGGFESFPPPPAPPLVIQQDTTNVEAETPAALERPAQATNTQLVVSDTAVTPPTPEEEAEFAKYGSLFNFFDEFGTHWMHYVKMGAKYGLSTEMEEQSLQDLQNAGTSTDVQVQIAWNRVAEDCPGLTCDERKKLIKHDEGYRKAQSEKYQKEDKEAAEKAGSLERNDSEGRPMVMRTRTRIHSHKAGPRSIRTDVLGFKHVWEVPNELKTAAELRAERSLVLERRPGLGGSVGVGVKTDSFNSNEESWSGASERMTIISVGAKPASDVLEWAEQTEDENMPVFFHSGSICEIVELAMTRDMPNGCAGEKFGSPGCITAATKTAVLTACKTALNKPYCNWIRHREHAVGTMSCEAPKGGVVRFEAVTPECTADTQCKRDYKCINSKCTLSYRRITSIKMIGAYNNYAGRVNVQCNTKNGYEVVTVKGPDVMGKGWTGEWKDQIRGTTANTAIKLCVKKTGGPVTDQEATHGICDLKLSKSPTSQNYDTVASQSKGGADYDPKGDFMHGDGGDRMYLQYTTKGCEGRNDPAVDSQTKALVSLNLQRSTSGACESSAYSRVALENVWNNNGNLNAQMNSGGYIYLCQSNIR